MQFLGPNAMEYIAQATYRTCERIFDAGIFQRLIVFNPENSFQMLSYELTPVLDTRNTHCICNSLQPLRVLQDIDLLLALLPDAFLSKLQSDSEHLWQVRDIVLDLGQRPYMYTTKGRVFLCDDESCCVSKEVLAPILSKLDGKFGTDNRAGFDRQLHRISALRNTQGEIYGLTMRVGRHIKGNADIIDDILFGSKLSVLILGRPGCGKTTIIREIARKLSESAQTPNVLIVDTSNEIAGDGNVVHPSVGMARRMMVPDVNQQQKIMIECLQNHTPDIIIIDEIGRPQEVQAAKTVKERDVRLFASAHGDFQSLVRNPQLNGLVGGILSVTLGDVEARASNHGRKTKVERAGKPIFDIVIELEPGRFNTWTIIENVGLAVDNILRGKSFEIEVRSRATGYNAITAQKDIQNLRIV